MMTLPHFDVICDLFLIKRAVTWNQFVLYDKKTKIVSNCKIGDSPVEAPTNFLTSG